MTAPSIVHHLGGNTPYGNEGDACAIYLGIRKGGMSTFGTLKRALTAMSTMGHRTGYVNGEGDGAGIQTDIPRELWARMLGQAGLRSSLATQPGFWVGHLLIPCGQTYEEFQEAIYERFAEAGLFILLDLPGRVHSDALGRAGRQNPPTFRQIAGQSILPDLAQQLLKVMTDLEATLPIHFMSLSHHTVVYKVRGSVETLFRYYPDLQDRAFNTAMALCHTRYSTNTVSSFERAQPFALLGHNGEINTINRFREEARQIGASLPHNGSDSQDIDRTLHTLCAQYGLDLIEAMELIFPPVPHELASFTPEAQSAYTRLRLAFGPMAQGPAAIIARYGDTAVLNVDALGLRPLWICETEKEVVVSSERGAISLVNMTGDPRPLAPGEKVAFRLQRGSHLEVLDHTRIRDHVQAQEKRWGDRSEAVVRGFDWPVSGLKGGRDVAVHAGKEGWLTQSATTLLVKEQPGSAPITMISAAPVQAPWTQGRPLDTPVLAAAGWGRDHLQELQTMAQEGRDQIGALGFDGPLAALSQNRVNLADYFKETVAVVTNPAIDRGREMEVFSTTAVIGARPPVTGSPEIGDRLLILDLPILTGGIPGFEGDEAAASAAGAAGTVRIEELLADFGEKAHLLISGLYEGECTQDALSRLAEEAVLAVRSGIMCLILDDSVTLENGLGWLDPHLATARVDSALRNARQDGLSLRRRIGIVVRSAGIRTLHDVVLLCGAGADALNPYAMFGAGLGAHTGSPVLEEKEQTVIIGRILDTLRQGLEKVISTIGCHELRGYSRNFSAIGLAPEIASIFEIPAFLGSPAVGMNWDRLDQEAVERRAELRGEVHGIRLARVDRFYPKFWKSVESLAKGEIEYEALRRKFETLALEIPVALRHVMGFKASPSDINPADVEIGIEGYDLPLVIGAMSFGSQGELSYKAYAQAASALNIICVNGEGGELPEMMGRYKRHRGQQVASGRFGVNAEFLNSCAVIEIKIGQGAKPGEGGMLPASKVTPEVAAARRTPSYVSLLSPSNNHDLYSIEDLAQLIEELKTVNPEAKVSVKCPVVPNIGLIAVGVAKAGADIINLTGYDGATGAARKHALQYVGLPAEIGVMQAHRALLDAGIRHRVELWCDGGMKTGSDAVKMILLGANRVGFATIAMVAIGCTICRKCNEGTCHVGITTHIKSVEEADKQGLKSFVPRVYDHSVEGIVRVFNAIGDEMRAITASLGATDLQQLVGRADLLEQVSFTDYIDLAPMLQHSQPVKIPTLEPGVGRLLTRPRNNLTRVMTEVIAESVAEGEREVTYQDDVMAADRALGSHLAGKLYREPDLRNAIDLVHLRLGPSSIAGNGFAAWITDPMDVLIEGGAQDGVAKGASGGRVAVMKGLNHDGVRVDGSVGKSFAYGAQQGILIVQGNTDSRACIRLSGADVIIGGEITHPLDDRDGIGTHANIKGFACEYMTSGRVLILGDPGPYAFAGMTGGVVYQRLTPELGMTEAALQRRIARGASVIIQDLDEEDISAVRTLLGYYMVALQETGQADAVSCIQTLCEADTLYRRFVRVVSKSK